MERGRGMQDQREATVRFRALRGDSLDTSPCPTTSRPIASVHPPMQKTRATTRRQTKNDRADGATVPPYHRHRAPGRDGARHHLGEGDLAAGRQRGHGRHLVRHGEKKCHVRGDGKRRGMENERGVLGGGGNGRGGVSWWGDGEERPGSASCGRSCGHCRSHSAADPLQSK